MPAATPVVRIHPPTMHERGEWTRVAFRVEGLEPSELWFDVSAEFDDFVLPTCDPAIAALLAAAMNQGSDVEVLGPVSERLVWHLREIVMPLAVHVRPFLDEVTIRAPYAGVATEPPGEAVLTALSCGVDSFSVLVGHLWSEGQLPGFVPTHFLFAHIGHHGYGGDMAARVEYRWQNARQVASDLGKPILRVDSNAPDFYSDRHNDRLNWAAMLSLRNASLPLLLQRRCRRFLFASSHEWTGMAVREGKTITQLDPVVVPALGTERVDLHSIDSRYTRVQKTERVVGIPVVQRHLNVCIMEGPNCSRCSKCLRTLLTLEILGVLDAFTSVFDLEVYRQERHRYLVDALAEQSRDFELELKRLMVERRFQVPASVRTAALAKQSWRALPEPVRKMVGRVRVRS